MKCYGRTPLLFIWSNTSLFTYQLWSRDFMQFTRCSYAYCIAVTAFFSCRSCGVRDERFLTFLNLIWQKKKTNLFITIIYPYETYTSGRKVSPIHIHTDINVYVLIYNNPLCTRSLLATKQRPQKFPRSSAVACVSPLPSEKPKNNYFATLNVGLFFT